MKPLTIEEIRRRHPGLTEMGFIGITDDLPGVAFSAGHAYYIYWELDGTDPQQYEFGGFLHIIPGQPIQGYSWKCPKIKHPETCELLESDDTTALGLWLVRRPGYARYKICHPNGSILEESTSEAVARNTYEFSQGIELEMRSDAQSASRALGSVFVEPLGGYTAYEALPYWVRSSRDVEVSATVEADQISVSSQDPGLWKHDDAYAWIASLHGIDVKTYLLFRDWVDSGYMCKGTNKKGEPCGTMIQERMYPNQFDPNSTPYCSHHKPDRDLSAGGES